MQVVILLWHTSSIMHRGWSHSPFSVFSFLLHAFQWTQNILINVGTDRNRIWSPSLLFALLLAASSFIELWRIAIECCYEWDFGRTGRTVNVRRVRELTMQMRWSNYIFFLLHLIHASPTHFFVFCETNCQHWLHYTKTDGITFLSNCDPYRIILWLLNSETIRWFCFADHWL